MIFRYALGSWTTHVHVEPKSGLEPFRLTEEDVFASQSAFLHSLADVGLISVRLGRINMPASGNQYRLQALGNLQKLTTDLYPTLKASKQDSSVV